jgi:uncharacterized coiled-coil protein SlyX
MGYMQWWMIKAESSLSGANADITVVESTLTALQSMVDDIEVNVDTLTTDLSGLTTRVGALESSSSSAASSITSLQTSYASLNTRMGTAEANITNLQSTSAANSSAITALQASVASNTSSINANTSSINSINSNLASLQSSYNAFVTATNASIGTINTQAFTPTKFDFVASSPTSGSDGSLYFDSATKSMSYWRNGISLRLGFDQTRIVHNATGATIPKMSLIYYSGSDGTYANAVLARADSALSSTVAGWTTADIADGADGLVIQAGLLKNVDTSAFTLGQSLYLSPTVAGGVVTSMPSYPNAPILVGVVVSVGTSGSIAVQITRVYTPQVAVSSTPSAATTINIDDTNIGFGHGNIIYCTANSPITVNSSFANTKVGTVKVIQLGTGQITYAGADVSPGVGLTGKSRAQKTVAELIYYAASTAPLLTGDIA